MFASSRFTSRVVVAKPLPLVGSYVRKLAIHLTRGCKRANAKRRNIVPRRT